MILVQNVSNHLVVMGEKQVNDAFIDVSLFILHQTLHYGTVFRCHGALLLKMRLQSHMQFSKKMQPSPQCEKNKNSLSVENTIPNSLLTEWAPNPCHYHHCHHHNLKAFYMVYNISQNSLTWSKAVIKTSHHFQYSVL